MTMIISDTGTIFIFHIPYLISKTIVVLFLFLSKHISIAGSHIKLSLLAANSNQFERKHSCFYYVILNYKPLIIQNIVPFTMNRKIARRVWVRTGCHLNTNHLGPRVFNKLRAGYCHGGKLMMDDLSLRIRR